jgi:hypothetical protein
MSEPYGRPEYNLIGTADDPIPVAEPRFVFRAQDRHTSFILRVYALKLEYEDRNPVMAAKVREMADRCDAYPVKKNPDLPRIRHQFPIAEGK